MSLPRYLEYKDSGVEWLGEIPVNWEIRRLSSLTHILAGYPFDASSFGFEGVPVVRMSDFSEGRVSREEAKRVESVPIESMAQVDDILLGLSGSISNFAIVKEQDLPIAVNQRVAIVRKLTGNLGLLPWLLQSQAFAQQIIADLPATTILNISMWQLRQCRFSLPPSEQEQTAIATFLDRETAKIDALIAEQEKLLTLLAEKRQATISHAVTKGLNPDAPMKDSGVEWLGEVPAHWLVVPAKRVASVFVPQRTKPELNEDGDGTYWATMEDVKTNRLSSTKLWVTDAAIREAGSKKLQPGAVIASCVGNFGVASINEAEVVINQQLQAYIPSFSIIAGYLCQLVAISSSYFEQIGTAATLVYVNQQGFENLPTPVPPVEEQMMIIEFLQSENSRLEALSSNTTRAIDLLKERRTALISAAVTGKIDVRHLANQEAA